MFRIENFMDNDDIRIKAEEGPFTIIEYLRDLSIHPGAAVTAYYCNEMNVRKRQVVCNMAKARGGITTEAGAMQWTVGDVNATTGIKGAGDLLKKSFRGMASGEAAIKPEYKGNGMLILEPTYKHLFIVDMAEDWPEGIVLGDGMFKACESSLQQKTIARSTVSSALAGGEGLFNLCVSGDGLLICESNVPREELILIHVDNDVIKIDGSMAVAWSPSLQFTVERSGKSLIGSAASGEGLVNVYRGTGKILMAPVLSATL